MTVGSAPPYDPRAIANMILKKAEENGYELTNLSLQKLLYFSHAIFLQENRGTPLLKGYFEAWQYGPVHPEVYRSFKHHKGNKIDGPCKAFDFATNSEVEISDVADVNVHRALNKVISSFGQMSASQLVKLTHAKGGPWYLTVDKAGTSVALSMRIEDHVTLAHYGKMKLSINNNEIEVENFDEDTPFT